MSKCICLSKFYVSVRRKDGTCHKRNSLLSVRAALDRHLKSPPYNEKRLLILAHQAYYHRLPCPMSCLFVKYESRYDFRRKMTFKLPRPRTDIIKKASLYKSIIRRNGLKNQMRSICDIGAFKKF